MQPEDNIVSEAKEHLTHTEDTDKKIEEMAREAYLMRREIAIIAGVFFLILIAIVLLAVGSMTQVVLPV